MSAPVSFRAGNRLLSLSFEADIRQLEIDMPDWARNRIPSITRNALNDTADDARFAEIEKIRGVFDRPTLFIQRSPRYRKASREHLSAEVYIDDGGSISPTKILDAEVGGGPRRPKRFELALRRSGIMRPDEFAIPAIGQQRDAFGNLPGPLIVRILSQLKAFAEVGYLANRTARSKARNAKRATVEYFVPSGARAERGIGRLPRGIYERRGKRIRAVMIFVSGSPRYGKRYDFGQASIAKAQRVFPAYWQRYFYAELAKRTAG